MWVLPRHRGGQWWHRASCILPETLHAATEDPGKSLGNTHGKLQGETAEEGDYDMPSP